jgi:hypothetical protein
MDIQKQIAEEQSHCIELGIARSVGEESVAVITRLNPTPARTERVGNILRRSCQLGGVACKEACVLRQTADYPNNPDKLCADRNLTEGLQALGIEPSNVLMVAVTDNEVGFGDQLARYQEEGRLKENPEGWSELPGFNAFFARADEVPAIGSRLADCAHFEFEFKDREGQTVIGFEHGTRPNMYGPSAYAFETDGQPVSYTHHVLAKAVEHYGADSASFQIRLSSSIRAENFVKHFDSQEKMEAHIPGWFEAGFVRNVSNPDWQPGDPVVPEDEWHADARGLILHDIYGAMRALGIPENQFMCEDMLDPADTNGEFSSHEKRNEFGDTRDLYLIAHTSAFQR